MMIKLRCLKWLGFCCAGAVHILVFSSRTFAQSISPGNIVPDSTLGAESSRLTPNAIINNSLADKIDGGAIRGSNLFHSFSEFNINDGQRVYFANPSGIENILTRVTGGSASNILGTLGVDGTANLFLMNPNGIVFGKNASLDVRGSFLSTTANQIQFGQNGFFSATNPETPSLLTVQPSVLWFTQLRNNASITNRSQAPAGVNPIGVNVTGLRVPDGKSLLLVGGNVNLDGGRLVANAGRVELTGLASPGSVGLNVTGNALSLNIPNDSQLADVSLSKQAFISAFGAGGGDITINARNIEMSNSQLYTGIGRNLGNDAATAGDIKLNATGAISLKDSFLENSIYGRGKAGNIFIQAPNALSFVSSGVFSNVEAGAVGKAGNIDINSGSFSVADGSAIQTLLREGNINYAPARGEGGNINIDVSGAVNLFGEKNGFGSSIASTVGANVEGNGGNISLKSGSLSLADGTSVNASTSGQGNAGNISVKARDAILLTGGDIFGIVGAGAVGNAGNIDIIGNSLSLTQNAQIATEISQTNGSLPAGRGNGGNVNVDVSGAVFIGNKKPGLTVNGISTLVRPGAEGNSGSITINGGSLEVTNGSELQASNFGKGNTGNITINARDTVRFDGGDTTISDLKSRASNIVFEGKGGNINITTGSFSLSNFAFLENSTNGKGNAGNITINSRDTINLDSFGFISSDASFGSIGNAGEIRLTTGSLSLLNGSRISNSVFGQGNGASIVIDARDSVLIDGINQYVFNGVTNDSASGIFSALLTKEFGQGGNIQITTGSLTVKNNGELYTNTNGRGNAGNITINARDTVTFDGLVKTPSMASSAALDFFGIAKDLGSSGSIFINAKALFVKNGAQISASSFSAGNAGNIAIDVSDIISIDGVGGNEVGIVSSQIASQVSNFRTTGKLEINGLATGGNIRINAREILLSNGGQIAADGFGSANAGNITINARDAISVDGVGINKANSGITSQLVSGRGKGGNIQLTTGYLSLTNGAAISSVSNGTGDAGSILINARDTVTLKNTSSNGFPSYISSALSNDGVGKGGDIQINSHSLSLSDNASIFSNTFGKGNAGNIAISLTGDMNALSSSISTFVSNNAVGKGGDIQIKSLSLSFSDNAGILSSTFGKGDAGDIAINLTGNMFVNQAALSSSTFGNGNAGNITINLSDNLNLTNFSQINTATYGQGSSGNISINAKNAISLANNSTITSNIGARGVGQGRDIDVNARTLALESGSQISTAVFREFGNIAGGKGKAGDLRINASDSVILSGSGILGFSTGLLTLTERGASGDAGNITVTTGNFRVDKGAVTAASTFNDSKGGDITINANQFEATNGGQVITNTRSGGNAGSIRLNVKDNITIAGSDPDFAQRLTRVTEGIKNTGSTDRVSDAILNEGAVSGIFANTTAGSTGKGGNIFIDPPNITIRDGAKISVGSQGTGNAGNITLDAGILTLDNQASITAQTASSQGGNIDLTAQNYLLMRRNSQISTTAGTSQQGGDGGNITINTPFIVALPNSNSDITANAFAGAGGKVTINATGIFGIQPLSREQLARTLGTNDPTQLNPDKLPTNSITAISQQNPSLNGQVLLNRPNVDPTQGLVELPQTVVDPNALIAQNPCQRRAGSEFISTGGGGLPTNPTQALSDDAVNVDLVAPVTSSKLEHNSIQVNQTVNKTQQEIQPAQGWVINEKGEAVLTAYPAKGDIFRKNKINLTCSASPKF